MIRRLLHRLGFRSADPSVPTFSFEPRAGQLVSVSTDDGQFGVVKVLAVDKGGIHARLYVQRFKTRPRETDLGELSTAAFRPGHENPFSIGHMPLGHASFAGWMPELICQRDVVEEELDGYRMWQDADAGYF